VEIRVRDGTILRANVFRPPAEGRFPVILSAHPYGKDNFPRKGLFFNHLPIQYRVLRQEGPIHFSTLTTWEAPDPLSWVAQRYTIVNADLRGCGTSEGTGSLLSDQEAEDVFDLIQWAGGQPWSSGRVGMSGVSYLAISQYKAAALHPSALRAVCAWEGFSDAYRDFQYPGGILEDGFVKMWMRGMQKDRLASNMRELAKAHPLYDETWRSLVPQLALIEVPILVCGSFSDHCLHSRGSFRAFLEAGSSYKELYTHRGCKWETFYSVDAFAVQLAFFDRFLKSEQEVTPETKIRLEIRSDRNEIVEVRKESSWPLAGTKWTPLYFAPSAALATTPPPDEGRSVFDSRIEATRFSWHVPGDTVLAGPMAAHFWIELQDSDDIDLFVGVELWRKGKFVSFEGSYGYGRDRVTTGWLKASLRELDPKRSQPWAPEHTFLLPQPLHAGEIVAVDVALLPSSTLFRKDDELRLVVAGRWLCPTGLLSGEYPAAYRVKPAGRCTLHWGNDHPSHLLIPVVA
jgi:uncharacterized protein